MKWTGGQWQRAEKALTKERTIAMGGRRGKGDKMPRNSKEQGRSHNKSRIVR